MGMLTGSEILKEARAGNIILGAEIKEEFVGPNSYDVEIGDTYGVYKLHSKAPYLDIDQDNELEISPIPDEGLMLVPGQLYLIPTRYVIGSTKYIPLLTGRSSIGRLGISVHQEAGFGDIGFVGTWTMQVSAQVKARIYKHRRLAQIYFIDPVGEIDQYYTGKYNRGTGIGKSKSYVDAPRHE